MKLYEKFIINRNYTGQNVALIYPNTYSIGSSNLAIHTIFKFLQNKGYCVHRFFYKKNQGFISDDTGMLLKDYDEIYVSISYENDFINLIDGLYKASINILSKERNNQKIIIGGSAVTINPFLYSYIGNKLYVGEADENFLVNLYDSAVFQDIVKAGNVVSDYRAYINNRIVRFKDMDEINSSIWLTDRTVFKNYFLIEIARGCQFNCRFCNYWVVGKPYRLVDKEKVINKIKKVSSNSQNIGLISASLPPIDYLNEIIDRFPDKKFHFSSLRVDLVDDKYYKLLSNLNIKSLTIAPETGDDNDRYELGKKFTNNELINFILKGVDLKINRFKLYFILGLFDREEEKIINLIKKIRNQLNSTNKKINPRMSISVNPFIFKPFAAYKYTKLMNKNEYNSKLQKLKKEFRQIGNIEFSALSYKEALIQFVLANYCNEIVDLVKKFNQHGNVTYFKNGLKDIMKSK